MNPVRSQSLASRVFSGACATFLALHSAHAAEDAAKVVETTVGKQFTIELESNITTGFSWKLQKPVDGSLVKAVRNEYKSTPLPPPPPGEPHMTGGGGKEFWTGGGPRTFKKYAGTAEIVRVEKTAKSDANKAGATEGYEVWYTFKPKDKVMEESGKIYLEMHKEHQFVLGSSYWCPGPLFLKKYGIEKGKKFAATLSVRQENNSPPFLELDDVPDNDFFEAADPKP